MPQHQVALYEELFEACWEGDNATIRRLCSPSKAPDTEQLPIQIAAKIGHPTNEWSQTGLTTLSVAVVRGHWDTARLIFTNSIAQYKPDEKEQKFEYNLASESFEEDDSDDDPDMDLMDTDDAVSKGPVDFVDVAKRSSEVQTSVAPSKMLHDIGYSWRDPDSGLRRYSKNLITGVVEHGDVQGFTTIFDLYKLSDPPLTLTNSELDQLLETIISNDKSELLHEFIRKTGRGVTVNRKPSTKEGEEGSRDEVEAHAMNNKNKVYHGLNVHGKKRGDLAAKNDPNVSHDEVQVISPLVWRAAHAGSSAILDYLKSERPLDAYRHYSMCNSDPLAISLRRTSDLDKVLPQWLGWTINAIGESPLSAALLRANLSVVKRLFENDPKLMSMALRQEIKLIGYNLLMLAVHCGCATEMVDYLLSKGLSPTQVDSRGWNIYHILAGSGNSLLFQHFLKILPRDMSQALLIQPSKKNFDTPLHLAVENRYKDVVEAITDFDKSSSLIRNVKGSLPLHTAVLNAVPEITKMLLHASPTEWLHYENGVGDTPFEIATSRYLLSLMKDVKGSSSAVSSFARETIPTCRDVEKLEKGVLQLKNMIAALLDDKKLMKDSHLEEELSAFAGHLESQIVSAKPDYEAKKKREAEKAEKAQRGREGEEEKAGESAVIRVYDDCDPHKTYEYVKEAVEARPYGRRLVHLVDVQKSVLGHLSEIESKKEKEVHDHGDGLEPEGKDKRRIPDEAMIFRYHGLGNIVS
ncbi:hypothetical protein AAF712_010143 [Marasmius tenuissimus]|uniref:Ankyrin repeat protein n=1 Tax=Marasmius tenuissimus TaxID=585030 RepID=A0ABR2ZRL4_9AGAR